MIKEVLAFMDKAVDIVKSFSPISGLLDISLVEKVTGWADTAIEVGQNVLERAEEGKIVLESQDVDDINQRIAALHEENNKLAEYIKNS